jgi:hypothetical protein
MTMVAKESHRLLKKSLSQAMEITEFYRLSMVAMEIIHSY